MPEPANQFQLLSRFVRDNKDADADLLLDAATVRKLAEAIDANLRVGMQTVNVIRSLQRLPPADPTYEEIYGEPDPAERAA